MKISAKTEYACIAMLELAVQFTSGEPVRIRQIADRHGVPPRFLVQILLQLKSAGLVASVRGATGGYQLQKRPAEISLGRIMEVVDGLPEKAALTGSFSTDSIAAQVLRHAWKTVADAERKMLDNISLGDLLEQLKRQGEQMYHI